MTENKKPWTRDEFEQQLRSREKYYHINHDFHILMNEGGLDKEAVKGWVANRFYYQTTIPIKDAAIMSNCTDRDARRQWVQRIIDHDGIEGEVILRNDSLFITFLNQNDGSPLHAFPNIYTR